MSQKKLDRIIEIGEAVALIGDNRYLDGTTSFKIGMLGDYSKPIIRNFVKERDRLINDARKRQKAINDGVKNGDAEAKARAADEITVLTEEVQVKLNEMGNMEEEIKIPTLKLSEFIAKADITDVFVKDGVPEAKVVVRAGQALVPVKFFTLMGDIIIDDKNTDG